VTRDAVADYLAAGEAFVSLVERAETGDGGRLLGDLAIALADLYSAAVRLPDPETTSDELLSGKKEFSVHSALERILDDDEFSWDSIDWEYHEEFRGEPYERWKVVSGLANDLDEAYMDVRDHIAMLESTESSDDAVWGVRFGFWHHTCNHVIAALRPIHAYLADGGPRPPHDPRYPRRVAPRIDLGSLPGEQLDVRTRVARHLARVAAANGQDEAAAFRSAFTMDYAATERIHSYVQPVAKRDVAPLTDEERRYLEGLAGLE
jgi:uncharacterized protein DUF5063